MTHCSFHAVDKAQQPAGHPLPVSKSPKFVASVSARNSQNLLVDSAEKILLLTPPNLRGDYHIMSSAMNTARIKFVVSCIGRSQQSSVITLLGYVDDFVTILIKNVEFNTFIVDLRID